MHADHLNARRRLFHRACQTCDQAAASNRNHYGVQVSHLLEHFDSESSLPRDDGFVVERVNERKSLFIAAPDGFLASFVVVRAEKDHFGAVAPRRRYFHERRRERHADLRRDPRFAA